MYLLVYLCRGTITRVNNGEYVLFNDVLLSQSVVHHIAQANIMDIQVSVVPIIWISSGTLLLCFYAIYCPILL